MEEIKVNGEFLFEFSSHEQWVNKASSWFKPYSGRDNVTLCLDKNNNVLINGQDFMASRDFNLFPVKVYLLKRTINAI